MGKTVLHVFDKIDAPVDPQTIEACHRLKTDDNGRSNKVIVKFSKRKDMVRVMNKKRPWKMLTCKGMVQVMNKKKPMKNANLDGTGLPSSTSLFINASLCSNYKYLWSKCKALWSGKLISSFWL